MVRVTKKPTSRIIELQPIDNIHHKTDEESKCLDHEFTIRGVNYLQTLAPERPGACFFKYLDLESALLCLKYKNIRFAEPTRWEDKYEGRFYQAKYANVCKDDKCTPLLYACCISFYHYLFASSDNNASSRGVIRKAHPIQTIICIGIFPGI